MNIEHDELLRWLTTEKLIACESYAAPDEKSPCNRCNLCQLSDMLIAIVELHTPRNHAYNEALWCINCFDGMTTYGQYPCSTIKVVHKKLLQNA